MERPEITGANLAACKISVYISLAGIVGGATTFLVCGQGSLAEICGPKGAELA
ncbi:hypothetical protein [Clostridium botulinum]|uniref:hypothetical protein n=1 Tax=Clostridium botulinum TaxID=1491 RepID=UPI0024924610|nr:hypothetical protein [Clostridium botulinum]BDB03819.1 hypothetical protein CBOS2020_38930 [Clostridium botulinum]